jgi:glutathione S-transferase
MSITVHGVVGSPYLRGVLLGLEERGVAYRLNAIPLGDHLKEPHLLRHPFGRVPAFEHDDFQIYEAQAILRFIAAVFPGPALQPADARQAARMNQLMGITDCYFVPEVGLTITRPRFDERVGLGKADEAVVRAAIPRAKVCLRAIDDLKGDASYLVGEELTLADLLLAPHLVIFPLTPEGERLLAAHPRLSAWIDRMLARPSMIATDHTRLLARAA